VSGQAYYDVKLLKRDAQRDTIEVLLAVAARATVDPLLATVRQAGLSVDGVTVAGTETAGKPIELLPAGDKPARKWGNLLRLNLALLAGALLLGLVALLLPIWQKREAVIALNPLVGKSAADYEVSRRVHDEYTKLATEYNYITAKKQSMYPSLAILEEVTRISPDTTAAQSMDLKSTGKTREVTLIGEAQAASRVIEALEQSPLFQNASQRSQTRKGSLGTNEWFHVATEVKPKLLPAAAILGETPPEPVVAPPPVIVAPAERAEPAAAEPAVKTPPANAPPGSTAPAKAETPTGTQAPAPVKPAAAPAEPVSAAPAVSRKQP
jgi:general secretion pathway protein L